MPKQFLTGVPFPGVKGGRLAYKWAKTKCSIPRKVQRYFGLGRYEAVPRIVRIVGKRIFRPAQTRKGLQITGASPRARRASEIAGKLGEAHKRRRIGAVVGFYGGMAGLSYASARRQKRKAGRMKRKKG